MPVPPPVCDGYAFEQNGSAPVAIAAPLSIEFDDLMRNGGGKAGGGVASLFGRRGKSADYVVPNEAWCYRDTGVPEPPRQPEPKASAPGKHCRLETCFDLDRCRPRPGEGANAPLRLFIDTPTPKSYDMRRWPSCMRQTLRTSIVPDAKDACLVVPTVNINCEWDVCDPNTHSMLRAMPSWNRTGHNHVIWDYIDAANIKVYSQGLNPADSLHALLLASCLPHAPLL